MSIDVGLDISQFRMYVVRPALEYIDLWSQAAENLVLGTAIHESHLKFLDQLTPGPGPAYGLFQMERPTYEDIWNNYIAFKSYLRNDLWALCYSSTNFSDGFVPPVSELRVKLDYAAAMCRVHYLRVKEGLPPANDVEGLARYWKKYYNTHLGRGTVQQAIEAFKMVVP